MDEKKVVYFKEPGKENTEDTVSLAYDRIKEGDVKHVVVATHRGLTPLKVAEKLKGTDVNIVAVTGSSSLTKPEVNAEWEKNLPKMENAGIGVHRGTLAFAGVGRAVKARWGGPSSAALIADTFRMLGEGTKVCIEVLLMATDAGLIPAGEKVLAIAGTSRGADTCLVVKSTYSSKNFDLAIQDIVCKAYTDGINHYSR
jgi:hypothetical protein